MYCTYCNFKNESDNKFCESCGKPLQRTDLSSVAPKIAGVKAGKTGFSRNWLLLPVLVVILIVGGYALWHYYIEEVQFGSPSSNLPREAQAALDADIREWEPDNKNYNITSVTRGDDWNGQELWCVTMNRPVKFSFYSDQNILLLRTGNLWETFVGGSEHNWLAKGCSGWVDW